MSLALAGPGAPIACGLCRGSSVLYLLRQPCPGTPREPQQLHLVCEEFCEELFTNCKPALLKGESLNKQFQSGKDFCKNRNFIVEAKSDMTNRSCFNGVPEMLLPSEAPGRRVPILAILVSIILLNSQ
ncbi:hypothetical protein Ciccas_002195 [Cichlidogyrus casuarinus]|uniref:Uncharacterized protein n=1 Tax=Cichlidogyrus casuarinus TaxID=1844966 RepID=A0ABD2QIW6_9PLAT